MLATQIDRRPGAQRSRSCASAALTLLIGTLWFDGGCFTEPIALADGSSSGADAGSGTAEGSSGASQSTSASDASGTADATSATDASATEPTTDPEGSTSLDGSSSGGGEPDPFCDAMPATVVLCQHYDGEQPYAGAGVGQTNGTVDVTADESVTPPNSLVTTTNAGGDSTAELTYSTTDVPLPFEGSLRASLWIEPECLGGGQAARRVVSLVFADPNQAGGSIVYALNLRLGESETTLYECNVPACDMSTAHPVDALASASEWLDLEISFSASAGVAAVSINGATTPIDLFLVDAQALADRDVWTHLIVGQSSPDASACTMRFDNVILDAS